MNIKHLVCWLVFVIAPKEVSGDIMVLACPPHPCPHPLVDPDDVTALTLNIFNGYLSHCR